MIKKVKTLARSGLMASFLCVAAATSALSQQAINSIEVLVNDHPLSSYDINQRLRLVIAVSGGVKSEQEFLKVREQVIRSMVDEQLQLQEASTVDLKVPQAQLDDFFARRAQGLGQTPEQLEQALASIGSSKQSMQKQMEAEIAWSQLVEGRLGAFVSVSEEEVQARIQKIFDNRGKFEYRLAEIVLDVNSPEQEASVKANAEQLVERIKAGASFPDVAQQLSSSPTAAVGGDLGWLTVDSLDEKYAKFAENIPVGDVSAPIRTAGGFAILALRDRRRILVADPLDTQVALRQVFLTADAVEDTVRAAKFEAATKDMHKTPVQCEALPQVVEEADANGPLDIGVLRFRDLQGPIRTAVESLDINEASELLKMEDGWRVLVVCDKQEPQVQEPNFDIVHNQIEQQRLAMMGRRYLRDLRRDAIVDYR
ncbi:peptidylprolyl isomerase [Kordiimonas pumila]|uniref:Parvulin-like PPIase n=1 Tax=Kordiimonas pumila TaxID=2161677 RepID=A0ABV7D234_9PROT|nr:peptidylprolyl isomerase [Kordiimonas pumila]